MKARLSGSWKLSTHALTLRSCSGREYGMEEYSDYPFEDDEPWDEDSREREWEEHRAEERLERWRR